ncbi:hypothetical protein P1X15_06585 [Runella sp. MFBS21]|uniref:hypothetical protein n=1 Tax=Runella sp. MFBS21 TaxID=3034018 RepID=UPI0023F9218F|nr:hypothetical protein [Runella sp. MFBS21]MDF7817254.1 hypothetical protein [Runella sp. MFBS21]
MKKLTFLLLVALLPVIARAQDVYEITFTAGITRYRAALVLWSNAAKCEYAIMPTIKQT